MNPWAVVNEWEVQYDVRSVNLDSPVADDIDVLVAPQPSRLTQDQIVRLHDAIWQGVPTLIMEDPMPIFSGPMLGTSQAKQDMQNGPMGPQPSGPQLNGDLLPLVEALGLQLNPLQVSWSDYNPSHEFRRIWPRDLVWAMRDFDAIADEGMTTGIDSLLLPWPGQVTIAVEKADALRVRSLVSPTAQAAHGTTQFNEHFGPGPFGGMQQTQPQRYLQQVGAPGHLAVHAGYDGACICSGC